MLVSRMMTTLMRLGLRTMLRSDTISATIALVANVVPSTVKYHTKALWFIAFNERAISLLPDMTIHISDQTSASKMVCRGGSNCSSSSSRRGNDGNDGVRMGSTYLSFRSYGLAIDPCASAAWMAEPLTRYAHFFMRDSFRIAAEGKDMGIPLRPPAKFLVYRNLEALAEQFSWGGVEEQ
ncbi:hypothetical protein Taro_019579 [Colocasia esculenta]|uniref:Uncharacterized protein n=1 Tax=Colocasia esculenta TaxID=4460 RepID=A0A843UZQ6_COLES|nr:hypothetical protein [Colocasia esculenta]